MMPMADVEVKLPPLGDDAPDEARLSFFYVKEGDALKKGDDLCEMVTDKATFNVPSPSDGIVKRILAKEDDTVTVGDALAILTVT